MTILTLQPDGTIGIDTYINSFSPTANQGTVSSLSAGFDAGSGGNRRGLIKFDLSSVPANAVVTSAVLSLYCSIELSTTDFNISLYRSLIAWFEGTHNVGIPTAGENASTWNLSNFNGSVPWNGGAGGASGSDWFATPSDTKSITTTGQFFDFTVTADVNAFLNGSLTNNGWWVINATESGATSSQKQFISSDNATAAQRPKLTITYVVFQGAVAGTSTVTGTMHATGRLSGLAAGVASVTGFMRSNQNIHASVAGTSTAVGFIRALASVKGNSFGDSTAVAIIRASYHSQGSAAGTSSHVAHLKGVFNLQGSAAGLATATAHIFVRGQIRGSAEGTSTVSATAYARAVNVATVIGCNPVPLLHITDGSVRLNGQLNILNFLGDRAGYFLVNYKPQIFQYKDGGQWSSSPQSQGRRLRGKVFDNVIDVLEVSARAGSQDALIQYQQDLLDFQEAASDYWASDYAFLPYYLVARAARETNTRYAVIHMISCPELENPYTQPFFDDAVGATFVSLTIRIEHGMWTSTPPGRFDCVEVSGEREWTVSGWQVGV